MSHKESVSNRGSRSSQKPKKFGLILSSSGSNSSHNKTNNSNNPPDLKSREKLKHVFNINGSKSSSSSSSSSGKGASLNNVFDTSQLSQRQRMNRRAKELKMEKELKKIANEDPSIYEYDTIYDTEINSIKQQQNEKLLIDKKERKSKYMNNIAEKYFEKEKRDLTIREKRKLKERELTDDLYKNKEKFVTRAYKRKMDEISKLTMDDELKSKNEISIENNPHNAMNLFYQNIRLNGRNSLSNSTSTDNLCKDKPNAKDSDDYFDEPKKKRRRVISNDQMEQTEGKDSNRYRRNRNDGNSNSNDNDNESDNGNGNDNGKSKRNKSRGNNNDGMEKSNNNKDWMDKDDDSVNEEEYLIDKYKQELNETIEEKKKALTDKEKEKLIKQQYAKKMDTSKLDAYKQRYLQRKKKKQQQTKE